MTTYDCGIQGRTADASAATAPMLTAHDLLETRRVLVIAPHPDDEVLGAGGTVARLSAAGTEVVVAIVTKGAPPLFADAATATCAARRARRTRIWASRARCSWTTPPPGSIRSRIMS
jgi:hypothetical protein